MSEAKQEEPKEAKTVKPQTKPRPYPHASIPLRSGAMFGRPVGAKHRPRHAEKPTGSVTAKKLADDEGELMLFGTIGQDWYGEGITAVGFDEALKQLGDAKKIRLRVNSGGGDVFEATAIYNMLVKHDAEVIVEIEGVAASAATLISMAGDEIHISENAHFMIHAASGIAWGNAEDLRQYLKLLDNADELIRLTYSARTGISETEIVGMMDHDNWMTAKEAHDLGFVDVIDAAKKVTPHVTPDEESADNKVTSKPTSITPERLAAMASHLLSLSASVRPATRPSNSTGNSPQTVLPIQKETKMNAKLRAKCVAAGMNEKLTDVEATAWFDANTDAVLSGTVTVTTKPGTIVNVDKGGELKAGLTADEIVAILDARDERRAEANKKWRGEVEATIALAFGDNPPAKLKDECYDLQSAGVEALRAKVLEAKKEADKQVSTGGVRVNFSASQPRDRHIAAMRTGLLARSMRNFQSPAPRLVKQEDGRWDWVSPSIDQMLEKHLPAKDRPEGWQDFSQMPLVKLAEECLYADGFTHEAVRRLPAPQIAMAALGFHRQAGIRAEGAIHTTGSLAEITRDAVNKSLLAGYEEAPQTWRQVGRQGASVADFKDIHRVKLSAAGNLPVWNDNTAPNQAKLSNEKEKYAVEARAETLSFSWRLVINDDLDALSRRPQILGDASARTVNALFWLQITQNAAMADGVALFSTATGARKQDNLITGAATPTNSTIGAMRKLMRLQRGLNTPEGNQSEDILNLTPAVIAGPAALEELILKQVYSGADPASGGNSAVFNTARSLVPVIEPLLDANSSTAWYLFASSSRIDNVELTFLQGQETPFAHEWMDDATMCQNYTIIQTFGAKPIEWRSMVKHAGA